MEMVAQANNETVWTATDLQQWGKFARKNSQNKSVKKKKKVYKYKIIHDQCLFSDIL